MTKRDLLPRFVVAVSSLFGTEFYVLEGNACGPMVARYPRTEEGYAEAVQYAESRSPRNWSVKASRWLSK